MSYTNDHVAMRIEFDIAAQRAISQIILRNDAIEKQIEEGIKKAFESFDFEAAVIEATEQAIKRQIRDSSSWDKLSQLVRKKADEIVDAHIEKHMKELKDRL